MVGRSRRAGGRGFTLVELLVVIAIIAVLAGLLVPVVGAARAQARAAECVGKLRSLAQAVLLHAQENRGTLPRSLHSAAAYRERGWAAEIAPVLGVNGLDTGGWETVFERFYRCPSDGSAGVSIYSYGLNVYFELDPNGDDYVGAPATWGRLERVPMPSRTVLLAETRPTAYGDHFMAHLWSGVAAAKNAVAHDRHSGKSHYAFCDASVRSLHVEDTFDPAVGRDLWNPSKAR